MTAIAAESSPPLSDTNWRAMVKRYCRPKVASSVWQLVNTIVPYFALLGLMYVCLGRSYLLTLLLAIPAAGFAIRLFIISHDCGHHSFFLSRRLNALVGAVTAFLVLTPYTYWKNEHARHHASSGNLDRRGTGDIWTLTTAEYAAQPLPVRLAYRLYRNPVVLFVIGPLFLFAVNYRFWSKWAGKRERLSVLLTNLALTAMLVLCHYTIGLKAFVMIQLPVLWLAAVLGVWLFYVQHQFEDVSWERNDNWDFATQAIAGSSYYRLPRLLQWFSANIGFHHIHHLAPRIPNYRLARCHQENPLFHRARELTLRTSLRSLAYRLWDEQTRRMTSFSGRAA
ncbi:MAG: fatty acid desaturase [Kiritimatiellae bacterium]|nr:fatty acid desaturase [Kiritimatiellia bacterium]